MTVAVLCSRRAPGLLPLLDREREHDHVYKVVCCLTSERTFFEEASLERRGIPVVLHPMADFYAARGCANLRDEAVRAAYDAETLDQLRPYAPDILLLDGYLFLVTQPMLDAYKARMLSLHFSDLTLRLPDGQPRYAGMRAVYRAIADGCDHTRATVHVVNASPDAGTPIVRSWAFPVSPMVADARTWKAVDMINAYAYAHHQWMMRTVSAPLLAAALRLVSTRQVDLDVAAVSDPATAVPWDVGEGGRITRPAVRATASTWGGDVPVTS